MYFGILCAFSQNKTEDSTQYKSKKLTLEEVDFVSGYYQQNGNHSAVTGGTGTEHLTDFANTIDLTLSKYDTRLRKHTLNFEVGVDHYTSASSDKIDPYSLSSASRSDTRFYPSAAWSIQNKNRGTTVGLNASFSKEFDYTSFGIGGSFTKASKDNNREFTAKLQAYLDTWSVIYPFELRTNGSFFGEEGHSGISGYSPRDSYSGSFSYAQVVNKKMQVLLIAEPTYQKGLLATKYQRVFFMDGSEKAENLPDSRFKIPLGIRANYFLGDKVILRSFYRYYQDNWGLKAHTIELETPVKVTPFVSVSPFYRFYAQNGISYFAPYGQHAPEEAYYTSDYDLSKFTSNYVGANFRIVPQHSVLGMRHFNSLEVRYGHYTRSDGLNSNQVSMHINLK